MGLVWSADARRAVSAGVGMGLAVGALPAAMVWPRMSSLALIVVILAGLVLATAGIAETRDGAPAVGGDAQVVFDLLAPLALTVAAAAFAALGEQAVVPVALVGAALGLLAANGIAGYFASESPGVDSRGREPARSRVAASPIGWPVARARAVVSRRLHGPLARWARR